MFVRLFDCFSRQKQINAALIQAVRNNNTNAVEDSLSSGANVNAQDENGNTALMIAASRQIDIGKQIPKELDKREAIVILLHRANADINIQNNSGQTALMQIGSNHSRSDSNCGRGRMTALLFKLYGSTINVLIQDKFSKNALDYMLEDAQQRNSFHQGIVQLQEIMKSHYMKDTLPIIHQITPLPNTLASIVADYSVNVQPLPNDAEVKPTRIMKY